MIKRYALVLALFTVNLTWSQDCGCDHFVSLDIDEIDGASFDPGDVVCVTAGTRLQLRFENIEGTAANPIIIKNCGGEVLINAPFSPHGIEFINSQHVQLSGVGDETELNGFRILNTQDCGVHFTGLSNFFQVDHVKFEGIGGPAIVAKNEPNCELTANEGVFFMEDCTVKDVVIDNCKEGIAFGHHKYHDGLVNPDCGALFPHSIKNLRIENAIISNITDGPGIRLYGTSGTIENCFINYIHGVGIITGTHCDITIDKNEIKNTFQYGIRAEGSSEHKIYNNIFVNNSGVGQGAVWIEFHAAVGETDNNSLEFLHNTSVNSGTYNLTVVNPVNATGTCLVQNNLFCESHAWEPFDGDYDAYFNIEETAMFVVEENQYSNDRETFNFVNALTDDFRLTHESSAINAGVVSLVEHDKANQIRNLAGAPDVGAFEYVPEPLAYFEKIQLVGLYVDDFKNILGNPSAETELLEFAQTNGFNYLLLYNLSYIHAHTYDLTDPDEAIVLANFIKRAKEDYGIAQVGAVGEKNESFDKIEAFNAMYEGNWFQNFDVLNLEFEFWTGTETAVFEYYCDNYLSPGGYPCTNAGAYAFYEDQLEEIDARADDMGIISEIYLGYTSDEESIGLAERCDRILLHHYRTTDVYGDGTSIYNYHTYRIRAIALSDRKPAVMPIFSSRAYHMGPWLEDHSLHQPMETWMYGLEGYTSDDSEGVSELPISGYQWYRYTSFLDIDPGFYSPISNNQGENLVGIEMYQTATGEELVISVDLDQPEKLRYCNVYNLQGKLINTYSMENSITRIDLGGLNSGVYICTVTDGVQVLRTEKILHP